MLLDRGRRARMDVRGRAHLERHAPIAHERGEPSQLDRAVVADVDVVDDPDPMTESLRAGELERLPDRRQSEGLAGVNRDVEVLATDVLEGVEIPRRRAAPL